MGRGRQRVYSVIFAVVHAGQRVLTVGVSWELVDVSAIQSGLATATAQGEVLAAYSATLPRNQCLSLERP